MSLTNRDLATIESWEAPLRIECELRPEILACLVCPLYVKCPRVRELWRRLLNHWIREAMTLS